MNQSKFFVFEIKNHIKIESLISNGTDAEEQAIVREAKELGKSMDLNIVRLKFTAYLKDSNGGFTRALKPVVSNPIYDSSMFPFFQLALRVMNIEMFWCQCCNNSTFFQNLPMHPISRSHAWTRLVARWWEGMRSSCCATKFKKVLAVFLCTST